MQQFIVLDTTEWHELTQRFAWFDICDYVEWDRQLRQEKSAQLYLYEENGKDVVLFLLKTQNDEKRVEIPYIYWNPECKPGSYSHFLDMLRKEFGKKVEMTCCAYSIQPMWAVRMQEAGFQAEDEFKKVQMAGYLKNQPSNLDSALDVKVLQDHRHRVTLGELLSEGKVALEALYDLLVSEDDSAVPLVIQLDAQSYGNYREHLVKIGFRETWFKSRYKL